ncbi:MAG: folylpolyglutamate synthase/dihydrofolate synthase family protein [Kosmotogaceae bacterium]
MNYKEAIDYLYNSRPYGKIKYGLDRIIELLDRLGNPQNDYPVVHITGTNGKGSVASMLSHLFNEHGLSVGLNISPHIVDFRERIQLNNKFVSKTLVVDTLEQIIPVLKKMDSQGIEHAPSYFEVVTAMAFSIFKDQSIDIAVIEVGLGGRFDASNIIEKPLLSVITGVSLDHTRILGSSEEKIAIEKSQIIKQGRPLVNGVTRPCIRKIIEDKCAETKSKFWTFWKDFDINDTKMKLNKNEFNYHGEKEYTKLGLALNGEHQFKNAAVALKAFEVSTKELNISVEEEKLRKALKEVKWPGRFEVFNYSDRMVILDGAHNPDGAVRFRNNLEAYFESKNLFLLYGGLDDKDHKTTARYISPAIETVVITRVPSHRNVSPEKIFEEWKTIKKDAEYIDDYKSALEYLINYSEKDDVIICTGSLYLVSALRYYISGGTDNYD